MARDRASRPEARPLRLFVAVDLPADVRGALSREVEAVRGRVPGARWTSPEGWHVTLKFLGPTWPRLLDEVRAAVAATAGETRRFESALTEVGAFPTPRRARVLWVGVADPGEALAAMAGRLDDRLRPHFAPEKRTLTPHLTVARLRAPVDLPAAVPGLHGLAVDAPAFWVDRLVLYRSHLSPRGARYEPVFEAPLPA